MPIKTKQKLYYPTFEEFLSGEKRKQLVHWYFAPLVAFEVMGVDYYRDADSNEILSAIVDSYKKYLPAHLEDEQTIAIVKEGDCCTITKVVVSNDTHGSHFEYVNLNIDNEYANLHDEYNKAINKMQQLDDIPLTEEAVSTMREFFDYQTIDSIDRARIQSAVSQIVLDTISERDYAREDSLATMQTLHANRGCYSKYTSMACEIMGEDGPITLSVKESSHIFDSHDSYQDESNCHELPLNAFSDAEIKTIVNYKHFQPSLQRSLPMVELTPKFRKHPELFYSNLSYAKSIDDIPSDATVNHLHFTVADNRRLFVNDTTDCDYAIIHVSGNPSSIDYEHKHFLSHVKRNIFVVYE